MEEQFSMKEHVRAITCAKLYLYWAHGRPCGFPNSEWIAFFLPQCKFTRTPEGLRIDMPDYHLRLSRFDVSAVEQAFDYMMAEWRPPVAFVEKVKDILEPFALDRKPPSREAYLRIAYLPLERGESTEKRQPDLLLLLVSKEPSEGLEAHAKRMLTETPPDSRAAGAVAQVAAEHGKQTYIATTVMLLAQQLGHEADLSKVRHKSYSTADGVEGTRVTVYWK